MKKNNPFKLTIRKRITIYFGFIVLFYVGIEMVTYFGVSKISDLVQQITPYVEQITSLHDLSLSLELYDIDVNRFLVTNNDLTQQSAMSHLDTISRDVEHIKFQESFFPSSNIEVGLVESKLEELNKILVKLKTDITSIAVYTDDTNNSKYANILAPVIDELINKARTIQNQISTLVNIRIRNIVSEEKRVIYYSIKLLVILNLIVFLTVVLLTFIFARSLINPIKRLRNTAIEIGKGNFNSKSNISVHDEIGDLSTTIEQMGADLQKKFELENYSTNLEHVAAERAKELEINVQKLEKTKIAILNLLEDLSESKKEVETKVIERTRELSQERTKLGKIAENMETGAILLDSNGRVVFTNSKAHEFIESSSSDYSDVLMKLALVFNGVPINDYIKQCIAGENITVKETQVGDAIYSLLFQVLPNIDGLAGSLIWISDITDEKILEHSKSELVAVASHQLRTPLSVTKGNTELLLDESFGPLNDEQRAIISQTAESNENMILLVNQMLDITKIEQGKLTFELKPIELSHILKKVMANLARYAREQDVTLEFLSDDKRTIKILGDEMRLYQVFQNLIENAIKYGHTKDGKNSVVIILNSNGEKVNISVQDYGIGIPGSEQEKIFQRFYRASNAVKSVIDGTGLGLYIVQSIVQHLQGTIKFKSKENEGTLFTITFPQLVE